MNTTDDARPLEEDEILVAGEEEGDSEPLRIPRPRFPDRTK